MQAASLPTNIQSTYGVHICKAEHFQKTMDRCAGGQKPEEVPGRWVGGGTTLRSHQFKNVILLARKV